MCNKKDEKQKIQRRQLLQGLGVGALGLTLNPYELLFKNIATGLMSSAQAQTTPGALNYVYLFMGGGSPRWMFDLPLQPNGASDVINSNPGVSTRFTNFGSAVPGTSVAADYVSTPIYSNWQSPVGTPKYYYPYMWESLMPRAGGGTRQMKELTQHMFTFRGYTMPTDGHAINTRRMQRPNPSAGSLMGMVADQTAAPIPSIITDDDIPYASEKGISATLTLGGGGNAIENVLRAFRGSQMQLSNANVETAFDSLMDAIKTDEGNRKTNINPMFDNRERALSLFKRGFGDLEAVYREKRDRYQSLIWRSFLESGVFLSGVDAEIINIDGSGANAPLFQEGDNFITGLNTMGELVREDLARPWQTTTIWGLAEHMAVIEYVIENDLSAAVGCEFGGVGNLNEVGGLGLDMHDTGGFFTTYMMTKYYRAVSACIQELIDRLKAMPGAGAGTKFDETVIQLGSEFNRSAREDGSGSDHGWDGNATSIWSGVIQEPQLVGDIKDRTSQYSNHKGSWGVAAENDALSGRIPTNSNIASSLATVLRVKSPTPNDQALLTYDQSGNIVPIAGADPKNKVVAV